MPDSIGYLIGTNFFAVPALKLGRHRIAIAAMTMVGVSAVLVTRAVSMWGLVVPHFGLGLGIGIVDSSLMPLLAFLVDERYNGAYGAVYAIAQTAVSLAYGLGPLIGGFLVEQVGFPSIMIAVGILNMSYAPTLLFLRNASLRSSRVANGEQVGKHFSFTKHCEVLRSLFPALCNVWLNHGEQCHIGPVSNI